MTLFCSLKRVVYGVEGGYGEDGLEEIDVALDGQGGGDDEYIYKWYRGLLSEI